MVFGNRVLLLCHGNMCIHGFQALEEDANFLASRFHMSMQRGNPGFVTGMVMCEEFLL